MSNWIVGKGMKMIRNMRAGGLVVLNHSPHFCPRGQKRVMTNDYHSYAFGGNCVECNIDVYVKGRVPQGSGATKSRMPQCNIDVYVKGRVLHLNCPRFGCSLWQHPALSSHIFALQVKIRAIRYSHATELSLQKH